ncbi:MAG: sulfurtransferase TusA family protein [Deltaproteobacteria bacterium]|nr:sulfurtransferase TusA family protein [Deltaproteobacteria bacterium]
MSHIVDARGLSCPQPVLMTLEKIKKQARGQIEILVDTDTSRENVGRAARSRGWRIRETSEEGDGYRVAIEKD